MIIRVNSQSGKSGIAYLLERDHQLVLPLGLLIEFSQVVQAAACDSGKELPSAEIHALFEREYLDPLTQFDYRSSQLTASVDGTDSEQIALQLERGLVGAPSARAARRRPLNGPGRAPRPPFTSSSVASSQKPFG